MSLAIVVSCPEGLVLAAESRVTLDVTNNNIRSSVNFDNATKVLSFGKHIKFIGAVTYGLAMFGQRTAASYVPEFEAELLRKKVNATNITVDAFAKQMSAFYMEQWGKLNAPPPPIGMVFVVAGFNKDEPYGVVMEFTIPQSPVPEPRYSSGVFGAAWGGQKEVLERLVKGYESKLLPEIVQALSLDATQIAKLEPILQSHQLAIPFEVLALQDCVDLAIFGIRTTILTQRLTLGVRGCGGPIEVAIITKQDGLRFIQKKQITGETANGIDPRGLHHE